jgi:hypothetical protein
MQRLASANGQVPHPSLHCVPAVEAACMAVAGGGITSGGGFGNATFNPRPAWQVLAWHCCSAPPATLFYVLQHRVGGYRTVHPSYTLHPKL